MRMFIFITALWIGGALALTAQQRFGRTPAFLGASVPRGASVTSPTFVRSGTNSIGSGLSTFSLGFSFDCTGGNYCVVSLAQKSTVARTLSSITNAAGQTFAVLMSTNLSSSGKLYQYGLANPSSGDITATFNNSVNQGIVLVAMLFSGVSNTNGVDGSFSSSARTSESSAPASLATDLVVDAIGLVVTSGIDVSSGQTVRAIGTNATAAQVAMIVSTKAGAAGTTTVTGSATSTGSVISQSAVSLSGM